MPSRTGSASNAAAPGASAKRGELPDSFPRGARLAIVLAALVHVALVGWAAWAWIHGPFAGEGIVDGAEFLAWARTGEPDAFGTKSPLYPTLLRAAFQLGGDSPWTVAALGLALSLATLAALVAACRELGVARMAPLAAWAWALSGSAIAFAVQPLEAGLAACLVAGSLVLALRAARTRARTPVVACAALAAASVLARAPLAAPAGVLLVCLGWQVAERRRELVASVLAAAVVAALAFGAHAWPAAGALNLRLANGGARSGTCELRPGPSYDALRYDETFDDRRARAPERSGESIQVALLGDELAADPLGALGTLGAKALLFWHRAELVSDADFHHGLAEFAPWPILAQSFGLIAPLALLGLVVSRRSRAAPVAAFVLASFAVGVAFAAAARYRFPTLPAFVLLAAWFVATNVTRERRLRGFGAVACAVLLAVDWTGRARPISGDGCVQEAHRLFELDRRSPRARELGERAIEMGRDPRARYDLALSYEYEARERPTPEAPTTSDAAAATEASARALRRAAELYRDALQLEPRYAEASGNLLRVLLALGDAAEAVRVGRELAARDPRAGTVRGNLALAERTLTPRADTRALEAEAHRIEALRAWAQRAEATAREHARAAHALGARDPRLDWLLR